MALNVPDTVKEQYKSNSRHKHLVIRFPELDLQIDHKNMHQDSMRLKESVLDGDSVEFVGGIASIFQIDIENLSVDVKGKRIEVEIYTDGHPDDVIPLFHGVVDSAVKQANRTTKEIIAYDELYTKGNTNVSEWYKSLKFPVTLRDVRDSLFAYAGLEQVETDLPNDGVQIKKQYNPSSLQAVSVIRAVCQINGVFGIINRQGMFEYRIPPGGAEAGTTAPYPSVTMFPSGRLFPGTGVQAAGMTAPYPSAAMFPSGQLFPGSVAQSGMRAECFSFYKALSHEEFVVKPVDMVTIRSSEDDGGVSYTEGDGTGSNNYIIQGNMFSYGLEKSVLMGMAERIYRNVCGFTYIPFSSDNNGLPYIECGLDAVSYVMIDYGRSDDGNTVYEQKAFCVLNRELTGIQALRDSYSAQGEEYQTEFITDLQTQIDILKKKNTQETQETQQQIEDYTYSRDEIDQKFGAGGACWDIQSVPVLPTTLAANTVYLIQVETVVE